VLCQAEAPPAGFVVQSSVPALPPATQSPLRGQARRPSTGSESTVRGEDHDHAARSPGATVVVTGAVAVEVVEEVVGELTEVRGGADVDELPPVVPFGAAQLADDKARTATVAASRDRVCGATGGQR
jgi:hypothetical protein